MKVVVSGGADYIGIHPNVAPHVPSPYRCAKLVMKYLIRDCCQAMLGEGEYDAVVVTVGHKEFWKLGTPRSRCVGA